MDPVGLIQHITKVMKQNAVPGLSLAIVDRKGQALCRGLGMADVVGQRPVTDATLFRVGSISKMLVGLSILRLAEDGRLDLQAKVRDLVPEVAFSNRWESSDPVRVVHLLEHTTGWADLTSKEMVHNDPRPCTLAEGLAVGPETRTSRWRPGTRFSYCNSGPAVAAAIVEKVTGQRFEDYVKATLLKPLGMETADYFLSPQSEALLTNLYHRGGRVPYPYWHSLMRPSCALNASARDMASLLQFYLRRGEGPNGHLLAEASLKRMETPTTYWGALAGLKTGYGLCNYTSFDAVGRTWHGHRGLLEGGLSELAYRPEQGVGYFFSINCENTKAFLAISQELQRCLTQNLAPDYPSPWERVPTGLQTETRGWYIADSPRSQTAAWWGPFEGPLLDPLPYPLGGMIRVETNNLYLRFRSFQKLGGNFVYVGGNTFRNEWGGEANLAALNTSEGWILQLDQTTYRKVGALRAWVAILGSVLCLLAFLSVPVFALVWGVRWACQRMKGVPAMWVRILPLLAVLTLFLWQRLSFLVGYPGWHLRFGRCTPWSMGLFAASWAFALLSLSCILAVLNAPRREMNRWAYYHSVWVSVMLAITTLYIAIQGAIGLRTWA